MNQLALIPGLIIGLGLAIIVAAVLPQRPRLSAAIERLGTTTATTYSTQLPMSDRVGRWMQRHMPDLPGFALPARDLALINKSVNKYYSDKALALVAGLLLPGVAGVVLQSIGFFPFYITGILGLPLAVFLWINVDLEVKKEAKLARDEFARAVAVYLELAAAERRRGAPAAYALESAAQVGQSWVFVRIRQELVRARYAGTAPWDALNAFSEEIGVPELAEIAKIVRLSGEEGASVYETLRARGKALRVQLLNEEHSRANEASERMTLPMTSLAVVFVGIILTPLVLGLLAT